MTSSPSAKPVLTITYCRVCHFRPRALWLAEELLHTFEEYVSGVTLVPGGGGQFDIHLDGELVFSNQTAGRFPETLFAVDLAHQRVAFGRRHPLEAEACAGCARELTVARPHHFGREPVTVAAEHEGDHDLIADGEFRAARLQLDAAAADVEDPRMVEGRPAVPQRRRLSHDRYRSRSAVLGELHRVRYSGRLVRWLRGELSRSSHRERVDRDVEAIVEASSLTHSVPFRWARSAASPARIIRL
jgi:selenoprotein W-related protein